MSEVRLIDANAYAAEMKERQDALKEMIDAAVKDDNWELYDKLSRSFGVFVEAKLTLDNMPTVDAVPVEWIQGFMNRLRNKGQTVCVAAIQGMLEAYGANGEREPANGYGVMAARMLE